MKLNKTLIMTIFITLAVSVINMSAIAAVESIGEINVEGDEQGRVPAGSAVTLIITLGIDRSLAEPGEEIKTFEIALPIGFETKPEDLRSITRNGEEIESAEPEISGQSLRIVLGEEDIIVDFSSSIVEIVFDTKASDIPDITVEFRVLMRNLEDLAIGDYIKPGNADNKNNNNKFTLAIVPNQPPDPVHILQDAVEANPNGENDVIVHWEESTDPNVKGYYVYRDDEEPVKVSGRETTAYRDFNVSEGKHEYSIAAYKTPLVKSERSETTSVDVEPDQAPPAPPINLTLTKVLDGVRLKWQASSSYDVVEYDISFGTTEENLDNIETVDADPGQEEYEYTHYKKLSVGIFVYAVEAIDEAKNRSKSIFKKTYNLREPYPNPFTPLSPNGNFNKVTFPKRALDVEGEFSVEIYNLDGVLVRKLIADLDNVELSWDGKDKDGRIAESGIYVYQIQVGDSYKTGTVILAK